MSPLGHSPRRRLVAIAALTVLTVLGVVGARADLLQDLGATFERVAQELREAFPKVEARIGAVDGTEVRLAGSGVSALRPGLELVVYRKGELFRHPVTNQPLGHAEEDVATVVVTAVAGDEATARVAVTEGDRRPVPGDGARITAGRIPVAVLPPVGVTVSGETAEQTAFLLVSRFSALLEKTGRFLAVEPSRVLEVATPIGAATAPSPLEVARRLKAAVLTTRLVREGGTRHLETTWISGRTGAILVSSRMPLVRTAFAPRFAWEQTPELERRLPLDGPLRGLAVADLDGDRRPEIIVGDERAVVVYRWQDPVGLVPVAGGEFRPGGTILSLDAGHLTGTSRAQVVVVEHRGTDVRSLILEYTGDRLKTVHEDGRRFFRVIQVGREPWLLAQRAGEAEPFEPAIRRVVWQETRYRDGPALRVPSGVTVYGLTLMRLTGSPEPEVVALTPEDRLAAWTSRGRRLWTSPDPYGGSAVSFPFTPTSGPRDRDVVIGRIFGRIVPLPDAPEGRDLLVFENLLPAGGQFRTLLPRLAPLAFTQGRVHRLRWTDGAFVRVWQSGVTEGYIGDFALGDVDGDGFPEVVVGVVPRGLETLNPLGRPKGHLVLYELP